VTVSSQTCIREIPGSDLGQVRGMLSEVGCAM
jgi:hypothetical protein